jgi:hypothetical protein
MAALAVLGAIVGIPLLIALSSIFNGYALKVLWGWFIVPVFHLPQLSIPSAIGIALVVGYLTKQSSDCETKKREGVATILYPILEAILKPSIALCIGWIVQRFM